MILALLLKTLCLHAVACPCWLIRVCVVNYGGDTTTLPCALPDTPGAGDGGYGSGSGPGDPEWRADVVLISESCLTAVAQQVMRAQAGASGWQAFLGAPLESRGEEGAFGMHLAGGWVSWSAGHSRQASPPPQGSALKRGRRPRPNPVALHPLVSCLGGPGTGGGLPTCPIGVRPQPVFLGPRHTVHGAPRDSPLAGGGGPQL